MIAGDGHSDIRNSKTPLSVCLEGVPLDGGQVPGGVAAQRPDGEHVPFRVFLVEPRGKEM